MTPHRRHWLLSLLSLLTAGTWHVGCHKLENYMDRHSSQVIPSSASSLSKRQPRLFYRSTSTVTVSTTLTPGCWSDSSLTTTCAKRKKRSGRFIIDDPMEDPFDLGDPMEPFISPSKTSKLVSGSETLGSSNAADSGTGSHRDPRFIFYLSTTTTTTTSTSLASTTTFTLVGCIPLTFSYNSCS